jgi:hypothetical protein
MPFSASNSHMYVVQHAIDNGKRVPDSVLESDITEDWNGVWLSHIITLMKRKVCKVHHAVIAWAVKKATPMFSLEFCDGLWEKYPALHNKANEARRTLGWTLK